MSISEQIDTDIKGAMKAREKVKLTCLRNFKSALRYREIEKKETLTEAEEIEVLSSVAKKLRDTIEQARQGGREDLAQESQVELDLVKTYLPEQMDEAEIEKLAREAIDKTGAEGPQGIGQVMKELMPQVKGKADGAVVKAVVLRLLSG